MTHLFFYTDPIIPLTTESFTISLTHLTLIWLVRQHFFDPYRWTLLAHQFRRDNFSLNSLTSLPLLTMSLQAGLSALKTPMCYQSLQKNLNCPVCDGSTFGSLAQCLPNSHHVNSCIVCKISGSLMNEDNPPLALPNGYVYSSKVSWIQRHFNSPVQLNAAIPLPYKIMDGTTSSF